MLQELKFGVDEMKKLFFAGFFLLALQCHASLTLYGVGTLGVMSREGSEKFTKLEKYGGGIGLEYGLFSFLSLALELDYVQGN